MVTSLALRCGRVSSGFRTASASLAHIGSSAASLIDRNNGLHRLISTLGRIVVRSRRFVRIAGRLRRATGLSGSGVRSFGRSAGTLGR